MRYPKRRIKTRSRIYKIIYDLMQNAKEIDIKYPEAAVSAVATNQIADLIYNNYRRRVK